MGKATKATKRFAASGQLKKTIQARHKHKELQKKFQKRRGNKGGDAKGKGRSTEDHDEDEEDKEVEVHQPAKESVSCCLYSPLFCIN